MGNFSKYAKELANLTYSENGGIVAKSTGSTLLDLFATIGSARDNFNGKWIKKWHEARKENEELADNLILWVRDIRNTGCGERSIGRILFKELAYENPDKVVRNFDTIVNCGRWDDLFIFIDTPVENAMWRFINDQFRRDLINYKNGEPISLLAKWLKSPNTSSMESRSIAKKTCTALGISEVKYRKTLSALRSYLKIVEKKMSRREWDAIDFETVPSIAMNRYEAAFERNCPAFEDYKKSLAAGTAKINATTITPTDICEKFLNNGGYNYWSEKYYREDADEEKCLSEIDIAQWNSLINYVNGKNDVLVMADLSGSMQGKPLAASVGLATYFAQRNKGAYHNLIISFSGEPAYINLNDNWDVVRCFKEVLSSVAGYSTNMDAAFKLVYDTAIETGETPKALVIVSDGEMDYWVQDKRSDTICTKWNNRLIEAGLNPIKIISWNAQCRNGTGISPASKWVSFCSGTSAGNFSHLIDLIQYDGYEAMVKILSLPQFQWK